MIFKTLYSYWPKYTEAQFGSLNQPRFYYPRFTIHNVDHRILQNFGQSVLRFAYFHKLCTVLGNFTNVSKEKESWCGGHRFEGI